MDPYFLEVNEYEKFCLPFFVLGVGVLSYFLFTKACTFVSERNEKGVAKFLMFLPSVFCLILVGFLVLNIVLNPVFANASSQYGYYKLNEKGTTIIPNNLDDVRLREWINGTAETLDLFKKEVDPNVDVESVAFKSSLQDYTVTMDEMLQFFLWIPFEESQVKAYIKLRDEGEKALTPDEKNAVKGVLEWLKLK